MLGLLTRRAGEAALQREARGREHGVAARRLPGRQVERVGGALHDAAAAHAREARVARLRASPAGANVAAQASLPTAAAMVAIGGELVHVERAGAASLRAARRGRAAVGVGEAFDALARGRALIGSGRTCSTRRALDALGRRTADGLQGRTIVITATARDALPLHAAAEGAIGTAFTLRAHGEGVARLEEADGLLATASGAIDERARVAQSRETERKLAEAVVVVAARAIAGSRTRAAAFPTFPVVPSVAARPSAPGGAASRRGVTGACLERARTRNQAQGERGAQPGGSTSRLRSHVAASSTQKATRGANPSDFVIGSYDRWSGYRLRSSLLLHRKRTRAVGTDFPLATNPVRPDTPLTAPAPRGTRALRPPPRARRGPLRRDEVAIARRAQRTRSERLVQRRAER
jgi:hypothetical protein